MKLSSTRERGLVLRPTFAQVLDYEVRDPDKMRYPNRLADQTFSSIYFGAFQPNAIETSGDGLMDVAEYRQTGNLAPSALGAVL